MFVKDWSSTLDLLVPFCGQHSDMSTTSHLFFIINVGVLTANSSDSLLQCFQKRAVNSVCGDKMKQTCLMLIKWRVAQQASIIATVHGGIPWNLAQQQTDGFSEVEHDFISNKGRCFRFKHRAKVAAIWRNIRPISGDLWSCSTRQSLLSLSRPRRS